MSTTKTTATTVADAPAAGRARSGSPRPSTPPLSCTRSVRPPSWTRRACRSVRARTRGPPRSSRRSEHAGRRRRALRRAGRHLERRAAQPAPRGDRGRGSRPGRRGSANFERDAEMSLANNAREMLDQSQLALRHIDRRLRAVRQLRPADRQGPVAGVPAGDAVRDLQAARRAPLSTATPPAPRSRPGRGRAASGVTPARWDVCGRGLFGAVALVGLALDVVTKVAAVTPPRARVGVPVIGELLHLPADPQPGAAFSQGEGSPGCSPSLPCWSWRSCWSGWCRG